MDAQHSCLLQYSTSTPSKRHHHSPSGLIVFSLISVCCTNSCRPLGPAGQDGVRGARQCGQDHTARHAQGRQTTIHATHIPTQYATALLPLSASSPDLTLRRDRRSGGHEAGLRHLPDVRPGRAQGRSATVARLLRRSGYVLHLALLSLHSHMCLTALESAHN